MSKINSTLLKHIFDLNDKLAKTKAKKKGLSLFDLNFDSEDKVSFPIYVILQNNHQTKVLDHYFLKEIKDETISKETMIKWVLFSKQVKHFCHYQMYRECFFQIFDKTKDSWPFINRLFFNKPLLVYEEDYALKKDFEEYILPHIKEAFLLHKENILTNPIARRIYEDEYKTLYHLSI